MTYVVALAGIGCAVAMGVAFLRLSGLRPERDEAVASRNTAEITASAIAKEFGGYRKASEAQRRALYEDIERLEDDLQTCDSPGARRDRLRSLLSKAEARAPD